MATFRFDLVSPEKLLFAGEVTQVDLPGSEGDFGVLAGHAPIVTTLRPGILVIYRDGGELRVVVNGGFAEVGPAGLTVLADLAVPQEEFDPALLEGVIKDTEEDARRGHRRLAARQALPQGRSVAGAAGRAAVALLFRASAGSALALHCMNGRDFLRRHSGAPRQRRARIILPDRGHGLRAPSLRSGPGMTAEGPSSRQVALALAPSGRRRAVHVFANLANSCTTCS